MAPAHWCTHTHTHTHTGAHTHRRTHHPSPHVHAHTSVMCKRVSLACLGCFVVFALRFTIQTAPPVGGPCSRPRRQAPTSRPRQRSGPSSMRVAPCPSDPAAPQTAPCHRPAPTSVSCLQSVYCLFIYIGSCQQLSCPTGQVVLPQTGAPASIRSQM